MLFKTSYFLRVCFLACLVFPGFNLFAQKKVSGRVISSSDKQPVIGATVQVRNGKAAVQTAADGSFSIDAGDNSMLVISSIVFYKHYIAVAVRRSLGEICL